MKSVYVLILVVMVLEAVWGVAVQNSTAVASGDHYKELSRSKRFVITGTGIIAAIAAGANVAGAATGIGSAIAQAELSTSSHLSYNRNFEMVVANSLEWTLTDPKSIAWYGHISSLPPTIGPCAAGKFAGHKNGHTATGTSGIASWRVKEKDLTIVVLWSVPYSSGCNTLGIGIYSDLPSSEPSYSNRQEYFDDLYYNSDDYWAYSTWNVRTTTHRTYCKSTKRTCTINKGIVVCGSMNTSSAGKVGISVKKVKEDSMSCSECDKVTYTYIDC